VIISYEEQMKRVLQKFLQVLNMGNGWPKWEL
jgi:hypothetical protein